MKSNPYTLYLKTVVLVTAILCVSCLCGYRLMKVQLVESESYTSRKYSTYEHSQTIEATRGEIVDCNGEPIIVNKAGYCVVILPEQFPDDYTEGNKILLEIAKLLNSYNIEIELDKDEAITHGITATPCFILNQKEEKLIIPGVFSTEEFENALKDMQSGEIEKKTFV